MSTSVYSNLLILALHILHIFCKDNQNVYDIKSELEVLLEKHKNLKHKYNSSVFTLLP